MKLAKLVGPYGFAGLCKDRLLYMYMAWFSNIALLWVPYRLARFRTYPTYTYHCVSTFIMKQSQIHLVQASPNLGSGGSGYWSLLLEPTCPAKAHLHMLKALLGYSSWRCTSSTRLSRPLNAREKSDCSVVVSSLCQSMLVPSSCYRNPSDVKFWQNCGFWRCRSLNRLLKPVDKTAESVVSIHMYDHICIMLISFLVSRLRVLSDFGIFIAVLFDQLANPHSLGFMDPLRSSSMHGHNASLHPRRM